MTNTQNTKEEAAQTAPEETPTSPEIPLPSLASLIRSTVIAIIGAIVLLVFAILPAEYNIDPTGVGKALGLTRLSNPPKPKLVNKTQTKSIPSRDGKSTSREDQVEVEIPPGKGVEYKFMLKKGAKLKFSWAAESALFFDFHGEPKGDTTGYFESYTVSTALETSGTFTAPFEGTHGWFWENKSMTPVKVTLITSGDYEPVGLK